MDCRVKAGNGERLEPQQKRPGVAAGPLLCRCATPQLLRIGIDL
jgi:hypothetical protein